jgi:uncharacterized cupredoxin-like copper-binding protein
MRVLVSLSSLVLVAGIAAACTGSGGASPSTAPSDSAAPSAAPSQSAAAGQPVEVVGVDFAFEGVEDSYTGPVTFTLRNGGEDLHEMVVVRKNEGITESFEELLALPEDEAFSKVTMVGVAMAEPGQTAPETVAATEVGEYLMVCFIPQGTKTLPSQAPDASGPPEGLGDGPPHFTLGMLTEFSISE